MKKGLMVTPHDSNALFVMNALGKCALHWLRELVDTVLTDSEVNAGARPGELAPVALEELAVYMLHVSHTLCCIGSGSDYLDSIEAEEQLASPARPLRGQLAAKFNALTHLNVMALTMPLGSEEPQTDLDSQKLRLTRAFLQSLFLQLLDFIFDCMRRGKGLSRNEVRDFATSLEVGSDMQAALEASSWNADTPFPVEVAGKLIDCLFDKRLESCSKKTADRLLAVPFREMCAFVLSEEEEFAVN